MNKKKIILASVAGAVLLAVIISIIVALVSCNGGKTPGKENNSGSTNEMEMLHIPYLLKQQVEW